MYFHVSCEIHDRVLGSYGVSVDADDEDEFWSSASREMRVFSCLMRSSMTGLGVVFWSFWACSSLMRCRRSC